MPFTYCLRPGSTILLAVLFKNCSLLSFVCRSFTYRTVGVSCRHLTSTLPPNSTLEMLSSLLRCSNKARRSSYHLTRPAAEWYFESYGHLYPRRLCSRSGRKKLQPACNGSNAGYTSYG